MLPAPRSCSTCSIRSKRSGPEFAVSAAECRRAVILCHAPVPPPHRTTPHRSHRLAARRRARRQRRHRLHRQPGGGRGGGQRQPVDILLTGVAGLVAGAMSMAAGEYVSVHSQADTENADLARERAELEADPAAERRELTAIYVARGLEPALAQQVADTTDEARRARRPCARRARHLRDAQRAAGAGGAGVGGELRGRRGAAAGGRRAGAAARPDRLGVGGVAGVPRRAGRRCSARRRRERAGRRLARSLSGVRWRWRSPRASGRCSARSSESPSRRDVRVRFCAPRRHVPTLCGSSHRLVAASRLQGRRGGQGGMPPAQRE